MVGVACVLIIVDWSIQTALARFLDEISHDTMETYIIVSSLQLRHADSIKGSRHRGRPSRLGPVRRRPGPVRTGIDSRWCHSESTPVAKERTRRTTETSPRSDRNPQWRWDFILVTGRPGARRDGPARDATVTWEVWSHCASTFHFRYHWFEIGRSFLNAD